MTAKPPAVRQLPQQRQRVESGPVQFGEDWPGLFIRGGNCVGLIPALEDALRICGAHARQELEWLLEQFRATRVGGDTEVNCTACEES